jgi:hypothetical protein
MPIMVPQQNITQTLVLNQAELLTLFSTGFTIAPALSNYINVFVGARISYRFSTTIFTNTNNLLSFQQGGGSPIIVSNSLNALNLLGLAQNTNATFVPANPYAPLMSSSDNLPLQMVMAGSDILGGDSGSSLAVTFTYSVFQKT